MANLRIVWAWILVLGLAAFGGSAGAAEVARDGVAVAEARGHLKEYLALLMEGKWEAAAASCYSVNEYERVLARAKSEAMSEYYACDRLALKRFGKALAGGRFSQAVSAEMIDKAEVTLAGDRALIAVDKDVRFPLLRVDGRWRVSMAAVAKLEEMSASLAAARYTKNVVQLKKLRTDLERLEKAPPAEELAKAGDRAREAMALRPTAGAIAKMARDPGDATPEGALRLYVAYCAATRLDDAKAMCHATGERADALGESTGFYGGTEQNLYQVAVLRFGRAGADRILPHHLSPEVIDRSEFTTRGNVARAKLPWGELLPLVKVDGHWRFAVSEFCRMNGRSPESVIRMNADGGLIFNATAKELAAGKHESPEAAIAAMMEKGMRFPTVPGVRVAGETSGK
jgi:hypothetical protein